MRSAARRYLRWLVALGAGLATGVALFLLALWVAPAGAEGSIGRHEAPLVQAPAQAMKASAPSVRVTGAVVGSRVAVVDEDGTIVAIFSNTFGLEAPLDIRLGSASGPKLDATPSVLKQYEKLMTEVDWGRAGLVYQRP